MSGVVSVMAGDWWGRYVGLPFVDGGRGEGGLDCWGLVRAVYLDVLGVELPTYGEISARDLLRVARQMSAGKDDGWVEPVCPEDTDVVLMRSAKSMGRVVHVGLVAGGAGVLHTEAATGCVLVPRRHVSVCGRIVGYRRRVA